MSSLLRVFLLMLCIWALVVPATQASHLLGGQITYEHLTGDQYRVRCLLYTNDNSLVRQEFIQLNCQIDGCAASDSRNFKVELNNPTIVKNLPFPLSNGVYSNAIFETTVQLSPGTWTLSTQLENRSSVSNLANPGEYFNFYIAATVNTLLAPDNSSPQFYSLPVPQVLWQRQNRYAYGAYDTDGDSLIYSLVSLQASCDRVVPYSTYAAGTTSNPNTNAVASYPGGGYTNLFPFPSFQITYSGATPQAFPFFNLNTTTGAITSLPAPIQSGGSNFAVAVRVNEFRKIGGTYVEIGSVVREVPYILVNPGNNFNPTLSALRVNNETASRPLDNTITVLAGQPLTLHFTGTDPDAGQTTQLYADIERTLPSATFATPAAGEATLQWQTTAQTRLGFYRFPVTVVDDSSPQRGFETRIITVRVVNAVLAAGAAQDMPVLFAYPVPFTEQVTIRLGGIGRRPVTIVDALGRTVAELTTQADGSVRWQPATSLAPGVYIARTPTGQSKRLLRVGP